MPNKAKGKKLTAFGKKVKKRLIDLDMEQKDLARRVGTSDANISYILYGDRSGEMWIAKICEVLEIKQRGSDYDSERRCG